MGLWSSQEHAPLPLGSDDFSYEEATCCLITWQLGDPETPSHTPELLPP